MSSIDRVYSRWDIEMLGNNQIYESFWFSARAISCWKAEEEEGEEEVWGKGTTKTMHSLGQPSESCEMVLTSRHRFEIVSAICASFDALLVVGRSFSLFPICFFVIVFVFYAHEMSTTWINFQRFSSATFCNSCCCRLQRWLYKFCCFM